ncbi:flagellar motor switch protein FliM [Thermohalobacter berrensis]|uniref:Flagellar motor switch protein FliM n=1 Tax=Thermohalobacter berrensis TaxID=99594 RepID=A0A419TAD3_9FIRM|nr:flagellar motor switch protein FliM [Thermohalobacter berrensis]RKD34444.1 flagellar motor switch protein FliM [Thermohalobacter berrensis]
MSEVLSQNEIDALLQALNSGEVDVQEIKEESEERKVKKYDFRNPQKIAKDQLRTLEIIYDNFGRLTQTFLSGYLRSPVNIEILTVDQYAYSEFSNAISNPAFLSIIDFKPLSGQIIMDISTKTAFAMIDRLLGGKGKGITAQRSFTEIELVLLKKIVNRLLNLMAQAWENVIDIRPTLDKVETNPQFAQIISPNETIALVTMNITIEDVEGMINICIPHITIETILDKLSTKLWFSAAQQEVTKDDIKAIENRLKKAKVTLKAEIGAAKLTIGELLDLDIGDVIKLDSKYGDEIKIKLGSNVKYFGTPGKKNNKLAVKISRIKKDGEDIDEQ